MRRLILVLALLFVALIPLAAARAATAPALRVSGNQLVDASGAPVTLKGVNMGALGFVCAQNWTTDPFGGLPEDNAQTIASIKSWGANAVRVTLNEDCWLGINGVEIGGATYQSAVKKFVADLRAAGLYVILDLHWNAPGTARALSQQPMADADHSPAFWASVASTFAGDQGVVYDLYNEPFFYWLTPGEDQWNVWLHGGTITQYLTGGSPYAVTANWQAAGMQSLLDAVRGAGAGNVVLINGVNWARDPSGILSHLPVDPDKNTAFGFHSYPSGNPSLLTEDATPAAWDANVAPLAAKYPVIAGETGDSSAGPETYLPTFLPWASQHGLSVLAWAWDSWQDASDVLVTNMTTGAPTAGEGVFFKGWLGAAQSAPVVSGLSPAAGPVGTRVALSGAGFSGATKVTFNGTSAAFSVSSDSALSATVPSGATSGSVVVTTPSGSGTGPAFSVTAAPPPPTGALPLTKVVGINVAGGYGSQVPTAAMLPAQVAEAAQQLHVTWVRYQASWWRMDPGECVTSGCINWSLTDALAQAAAANHVGMVFSLGSQGWPTGATSPVNPSPTFWPQFVSAFTARYDKVLPGALVIETWNEPELNGFPAGSAAQFMTQYAIPTYNAVKSVDPHVPVTLETVDYAASDGIPWWAAAVPAAAGKPFADLPGFHDYANLAGTETPAFKSFLAAHGVAYTAVWMDEFGAGITPPVTEPDSAHITVLQSHLPATLAGSASAPDAAMYYSLSDLSEGGVVHASYGLESVSGAHYDSYAVFQSLVGAPPPPPAGPAVTGISPASGPAGTVVTLTGSGLTGTTAVALGLLAVPYTVVSDTRLILTVPPGALSGAFLVTTPSGSASSPAFTVTAPPPPPATPVVVSGVPCTVTINGVAATGTCTGAFVP